MPTVQTLRAQARDLDIQGRSSMNKAELLAAIAAARQRLEGATAASESVARPSPPPAPPAPERATRTHRHAGALPLLAPLALPPLPAAYDVTHMAVLPRNPHEVVVFWAVERKRFPAEGATIELHAAGRRIRAVPVDRIIGRWFFGDLPADQALQAFLVGGGGVVASSGVVLTPPDGPSGLHQPVLARIEPSRPLARLPRDLRVGAGPTELSDEAPASERAWVAATGGAPAPSPGVRLSERAARLSRPRHDALVSSFVHAATEEGR